MISSVVRTCFPVAAKVVADRAEEINKLNVFPVPDGDTGTNMSLTLGTVVREVEALPASATMDDVSKAITHGSLMGARGNSGVITSQILRGIAEGLCDAKDQAHATPADVAHAFRRGVRVAFKAVRKPVEGTILTVLRDVSARADQLEKSRDLTTHDMLEALVVEAYESVARTPELLPVLKENGVVDSGAFGFAVFMEAFVNAATGKAGELTDFKTTVDAKADVSAKVAIELNDDWEGSEFRYCNEFLFKAERDFDVDESLAYLATLGDCELIVGAYPDFKVHVHSNEPNRVLEYMLQFGQVYEVFIHNMDMESHDRTAKIAADQAEAADEKDAGPRKELGFVAVAAGSGEEEILRSLGVDVVVSGGQTMNPSTADILAAIEQANADNVIVLPGNGNIRMAAEAAASACEDARVAVVPTKTVLQGFSAMFAVDAEATLEENVEAMTEAIAGVRGGEVTTAVRDSQAADGSPIHAGDVMGIQDDSIDVVGSDVTQVTLDLIARMQDEEEGDSLTILAGQDMDDAAFEALVSAIEEAQPDLEVDPHRGEQPLYPVIFSIE
ncbi:MAG TPA: DAK2 domain-containing protein [Candidatus Olsenella excrementigallinarum]|uniref:DAK2 domain-containing protein n=1 Tax=Olsenella timonensis TaxID=1805478 RepID=UPI00094E8B93|nr:DAK2 domain-containing protein [Olsenella timonensis]HJB48777.1 DAK2 domain-containing protein [Candidatus Olsenella excrementigallinarum]